MKVMMMEGSSNMVANPKVAEASALASWATLTTRSGAITRSKKGAKNAPAIIPKPKQPKTKPAAVWLAPLSAATVGRYVTTKVKTRSMLRLMSAKLAIKGTRFLSSICAGNRRVGQCAEA
jgi:hypothetical protein